MALATPQRSVRAPLAPTQRSEANHRTRCRTRGADPRCFTRVIQWCVAWLLEASLLSSLDSHSISDTIAPAQPSPTLALAGLPGVRANTTKVRHRSLQQQHPHPQPGRKAGGGGPVTPSALSLAAGGGGAGGGGSNLGAGSGATNTGPMSMGSGVSGMSTGMAGGSNSTGGSGAGLAGGGGGVRSRTLSGSSIIGAATSALVGGQPTSFHTESYDGTRVSEMSSPHMSMGASQPPTALDQHFLEIGANQVMTRARGRRGGGGGDSLGTRRVCAGSFSREQGGVWFALLASIACCS